MLDTTATSARLQRTHGTAAVEIGCDGRLKGLRQSGSAKAMLPKMHGRPPEIVFLNTAGGVTSGDALAYRIDLAAGTSAVGTTQTAERAYRSLDGRGSVTTDLSLGAEARLHWLPQELIVFDGAAIARTTRVEMHETAELAMLDTLVLGRGAMGEVLHRIDVSDRREVWRGGRLEMVEPVTLAAEDLRANGRAGLDGAVALASLSLFAPDAEDRLAAVRAVLPQNGPVRAAASAWARRMTLRFMAADPYALRRAVAVAVATLTRAPLPRVWQI